MHFKFTLCIFFFFRYTPLHPKETVRNIFLGKRVSFEFYKSFKDKKDLLDEALTFSDGDAILAVRTSLSFTFPVSLLENCAKIKLPISFISPTIYRQLFSSGEP